jgi:hypothetical protein
VIQSKPGPYQLNNLTPIQRRYYHDETHRFQLVGAGRRSRKTLIARRKTLLRALDGPEGGRYFHGAPTRDQAKKIFWNDLKRYTLGFREDFSDGELWVRLRGGTEIHVIGLDKPARIEGQPWNGCHITEIADIKPDSWNLNIRPVLADTNGWAILDGVPEMGNVWYRDLAKSVCGGVIPPTVPLDGAFGNCEEWKEWCYYSWFSSDVLNENEMAELRKTYDPKVFRQEFEGAFETLEGQVYYGFNADYYPHGNLDKDAVYDKNLPVYLFMDFNVSPMTALLCHVKVAKSGENQGKQEVHVFHGYHLENSNTKSLITRILTEWPQTRSYVVVSCQSGSSRQTVADIAMTDRRIIKNELAAAGKACQMGHRSRNPAIMSRIHAVNSMLSHNRVRINPEPHGCKMLIKDLEGLTFKAGTSDVDKSNPMMEHISSALGYGIERYWPIRTDANLEEQLDGYKF